MDNEKIKNLISQMTIEEKVNICCQSSVFCSGGVERLNLPELHMADGSHGIRPEHGKTFKAKESPSEKSSYFLSGIALAATWNTELAELFGKALGREARDKGIDIILAPAINVIRTPLCGRNFEYLSEDPYLISKMAVPIIKGIQSMGVAACVKHFSLNNQEHNRKKADVWLDDGSLHEIYLPGFKAAVMEAGVLCVMGAYNKFRGEYCCQNEQLLIKILKQKWGFNGVVISDWGAVNNTCKAALNDLDIEMGSRKYFSKPLLSAIKKGKIPESVLDDKVRRNLYLRKNIGMLDGSRTQVSLNQAEHQELSHKIASESIVLLKNHKSILPFALENISSIVVIGDNAVRHHATGGGSSDVNAYYEISPLEGITNFVNTYAKDKNIKINFSQGYSNKRKLADSLRQEAVNAACNSDAVVIFAGLNHDIECEGRDRKNMKLPYDQDRLIYDVCSVNPRTVVVIVSGSPVEMKSWINSASAILQMFYAGMESGNAIADILFGKINPSGKLPVTFPKNLKDSPAHFFNSYPGGKRVTYIENIMVGYRYFDTYNIKPEFCFGHGLSYTEFAYGNLKVKYNKEKSETCLSAWSGKPLPIMIPMRKIGCCKKVIL